MSSATYYPCGGKREPHVVELDLRLNIGATGSILSTSRYRGVSSVTRNATGDYTLTLSDAYPASSLVGMSILMNVNSTTATDLTFQPYSVDEAGKSVKFKCLTGATATDPGSGSSLFVGLKFRNTGG